MAYTGTIVTEAEIELYAGGGVSATVDTEANHNILVAQAESYISNVMRYNVVDNYGSLNEDVKRMLSEWAARYSAIGLISYDIENYTTETEAENLINIHAWRMEKIEEYLKDQNTVTYIKGA